MLDASRSRSTHPDVAPGRKLLHVDKLQNRALAGATWTGEKDELSLSDGKRHVVEGETSPGIFFEDVSESNHGGETSVRDWTTERARWSGVRCRKSHFPLPIGRARLFDPLPPPSCALDCTVLLRDRGRYDRATSGLTRRTISDTASPAISRTTTAPLGTASSMPTRARSCRRGP